MLSPKEIAQTLIDEGKEKLSRYVVEYDSHEKVKKVEIIVPDEKELKQVRKELSQKSDERDNKEKGTKS
jgi:uncharacterized protein YrzB (UPF0473 family)